MTTTITTNGHARELLSLWELPAGIAESEFPHVTDEDGSYRFFKYRGTWYDVNDSQVIGHDARMGWGYAVAEDSPLAKWDGIQTDSFFSAIVFRYVPGTSYEFVTVGLALS